MAVISVDAGTTMIKAVAYRGDGAETAVVREQTALVRRQPGWVEQDMAEVWDAVVHAVRLVAAELYEPVEFVALTAQGDGCWLVDHDGRPTGPAILWNDGRGASTVAGWWADGVLQQAFRINGSLGFAGLPHAILTWLRAHQPDRVDRSATALTCGGWLFSQFTGRIGVDVSDAAAPWMDLRTGQYSARLIELFGLDWATRLLPEVLDGADRVAALSVAAAARVGLPAGTPVVLASYDIAATAIGCGAIESGQACAILGTTLCTEVVADRADVGSILEGVPAGLTVPLGVPGQLLRALPTLAGGEVIGWVRMLLGLGSASEVGELAAPVPPGAGGLCFLPYLSPAGERAPFLDDTARGALRGLSVEHTRADVARAVLEGLTLVIRDCLDASGVTPTELRVCGGGATSTMWCQLIADVTGVAVARGADTEIGARGAMVLGAAAVGAAATVSDAVGRFVAVRDSFVPDPGRRGLYDALYQDFLALRACESTEWPRLARMRARSPVLASGEPVGQVRPSELAELEELNLDAPASRPSSESRPGPDPDPSLGGHLEQR